MPIRGLSKRGTIKTMFLGGRSMMASIASSTLRDKRKGVTPGMTCGNATLQLPQINCPLQTSCSCFGPPIETLMLHGRQLHLLWKRKSNILEVLLKLLDCGFTNDGGGAPSINDCMPLWDQSQEKNLIISSGVISSIVFDSSTT